MLILSDIHIGVQRKGGVTPQSSEALRTYLFAQFRRTLAGMNDGPHRLVILGDLFDKFEVSPRDWIETYAILNQWLIEGNLLTLVAGNHDHSPKAERVSSFQMLAHVLKESWPNVVQVVGIDEAAVIAEGVMALAHCSNQDIFEAKLKEIWEEEEPKYLLLHANFDNNFAAVSDHSLNVSRALADNFVSRGTTLVFAHEHQGRTEMGGGVIVLGNQWPTSTADCLNNPNGVKCAHVLGEHLHPFETWHYDKDPGSFAEIDWRSLRDGQRVGAAFVRVTGEATSKEAADVINAIAALRRTSDAFVISNAASIDGIVETEALPESFEVAKRFDVMEFIKKHLDDDEVRAVESLLKEQA